MTTTDIAVTADEHPQPNQSALMSWVADARAVQSLAEYIANSTFVPVGLRGKPVEVMVTMLAGQELGLPPMATFRSIDVIQGTPALRAHAMRGLVQSHGHDVEVVSATDERCEMRGRRKGSTAWQPVEWDIARAKRLGLTSKDQWQKQPRTMLIARATGEICRLIAADVLYAMPYAAEELDEQTPVRATASVTAADLLADRAISQVASSDAQTRSNAERVDAIQAAEPRPTQRKLEPGPQPITEPASPLDREPVEIGDAPLAITPAQSRKLHTLLGKTGRGDREEGLKYLTLLLRTDPVLAVETTKTLTAAEASIALDDLQAQVDADAERERQIAGEIPQWPELT